MTQLPLVSMGWLLPALAWAHTDSVPHEDPGWTLTPAILIPLASSLLLYALGAARLFRRAHRGRSVLLRRAIAFAAGWLTLAAAAISPLHEAGENSFTLHMIEHELLMLVAAPLLVWSRPLQSMLWAWPGSARKFIGNGARSSVIQSSWQFLTGAGTATFLQGVALWLWHVPMLFELALARDGWHIAQHLSFLISALLFWSAMFHSKCAHAGHGLAVLCLFATSIISGALGALMAFSESPWYPRYASLGLAPFGLTPVEDQQLAGLLMWIPGGLVHAAAALLLLAALLRASGETIAETPLAQRSALAEQREQATRVNRITG